MLRQIWLEWEYRGFAPNYHLFNWIFHLKKFKLNEIVRIKDSAYAFDQVGIITRMPDWLHGRPYYEISTAVYPDGIWIKHGGFYSISQDSFENKKTRQTILKKRYQRAEKRKLIPGDMDPRFYKAIECIIGTTDDFVVSVVPEGRTPHVLVIFKGDEYGEVATIRLDKAKYWHKRQSRKLTQDEMIKLQAFFESYDAEYSTKYEYACIAYGLRFFYKEPAVQPDYSKLR